MTLPRDVSGELERPILLQHYQNLALETKRPLVAPPLQWGLLPTLAWVVSRDLEFVAAVHFDLEIEGGIRMADSAASIILNNAIPQAAAYYGGDAQAWGGDVHAVQAAFVDLLARLQSGALVATGLRSGCTVREKLRPEEFSNPSRFFHPVDGLRLIADVEAVRIDRAEVEKIWASGAPEVAASARGPKRTSKDTPDRKMVRKLILQHAAPKGWLVKGGEQYRTQDDLYKLYIALCSKERPPVKPYSLGGFKKWLDRHSKGEWV